MHGGFWQGMPESPKYQVQVSREKVTVFEDTEKQNISGDRAPEEQSPVGSLLRMLDAEGPGIVAQNGANKNQHIRSFAPGVEYQTG